MKFNITTTSGHISEYVYILKKYNMSIEKEKRKAYPTDRRLTEFTEYYIVINNLDELMKFISDVPCEVIVSEKAIEIYDDYRE